MSASRRTTSGVSRPALPAFSIRSTERSPALTREMPASIFSCSSSPENASSKLVSRAFGAHRSEGESGPDHLQRSPEAHAALLSVRS